VSVPFKTRAMVIHLYVSIIRESVCSHRTVAPRRRRRRKEGTRVTEGVDAGEEEERK